MTTRAYGYALGWGEQSESMAMFAARTERDILRHHDRLARHRRRTSKYQRLAEHRRRLGLCRDCAISAGRPATRGTYCDEHYARMCERVRRRSEAA